MISDMAREAMERDRLRVQRKEKSSRITESMHATNGSCPILIQIFCL